MLCNNLFKLEKCYFLTDQGVVIKCRMGAEKYSPGHYLTYMHIIYLNNCQSHKGTHSHIHVHRIAYILTNM